MFKENMPIGKSTQEETRSDDIPVEVFMSARPGDKERFDRENMAREGIVNFTAEETKLMSTPMAYVPKEKVYERRWLKELAETARQSGKKQAVN